MENLRYHMRDRLSKTYSCLVSNLYFLYVLNVRISGIKIWTARLALGKSVTCMARPWPFCNIIRWTIFSSAECRLSVVDFVPGPAIACIILHGGCHQIQLRTCPPLCSTCSNAGERFFWRRMFQVSTFSPLLVLLRQRSICFFQRSVHLQVLGCWTVVWRGEARSVCKRWRGHGETVWVLRASCRRLLDSVACCSSRTVVR